MSAAAKAKEPKSTIERVETDAEGVERRTWCVRAAPRVTVQIDRDYAVTYVQEGGPGGRGRGFGGADGAEPRPSATT